MQRGVSTFWPWVPAPVGALLAFALTVSCLLTACSRHVHINGEPTQSLGSLEPVTFIIINEGSDREHYAESLHERLDAVVERRYTAPLRAQLRATLQRRHLPGRVEVVDGPAFDEDAWPSIGGLVLLKPTKGWYTPSDAAVVQVSYEIWGLRRGRIEDEEVVWHGEVVVAHDDMEALADALVTRLIADGVLPNRTPELQPSDAVARQTVQALSFAPLHPARMRFDLDVGYGRR